MKKTAKNTGIKPTRASFNVYSDFHARIQTIAKEWSALFGTFVSMADVTAALVEAGIYGDQLKTSRGQWDKTAICLVMDSVYQDRVKANVAGVVATGYAAKAAKK